MPTTAELQDPFALARRSHANVSAGRARPAASARRGSAAPDPDGASIAATTGSNVRPKPGAHELHRAALAWRSRSLGAMLLAMATAAADRIRALRARRARRREARAVRVALAGLDDRTLRDLGFDRSEIGSVAAEVTGDAERTRIRSMLSWYGLPI